MKRFIVTLVILVGLGFLGWQIYEKASASRKGFKRKRGSAPVAVEVSPVKKTSIREMGNFTGSLYPVSEFVVAPKIAGRVEKLLVHIGDRVKAGQLMAVLDDAEYRQNVSEVKADLEVVRANLEERKNTLENAKREYERTVALRQKKIASASQLDAAESEYKTQQAKVAVAAAQVSRKDAALKMANVRLSYTQIRVPENNVGGHRVVGERYVDEGAMLAANKPIVSILDIATLIAVIHVIERDYPKIQPELDATVTTDAYPGRTFIGRVIRIAPFLKEKSREARVEIEIPNKEKLLKPGMFIRVRIQFDQHENATIVPTDALVKRKGIQGVFLADLKKKNVRFVPITLGFVDGTRAEVLDPAITGVVVILGHHLLEDGGSIVLPGVIPGVLPGASSGVSGGKQTGGAPRKGGKPDIERRKMPSAGGKS
jgi:RND family efflux transporter MFP subunit